LYIKKIIVGEFFDPPHKYDDFQRFIAVLRKTIFVNTNIIENFEKLNYFPVKLPISRLQEFEKP